MISKILSAGKGVTGKVNYLFEGRLDDRKAIDKKAAVITHSYNITVPYKADDARARNQLIADFKDQAAKHKKPENFVGEHVLSFTKLDKSLTNDSEKTKAIVEDYIKEMGLSNTQYLALSHKDTDIYHVHLLFNNIDNDGKKRNISFEKLKASTAAAVITRRHGLDYSKLSPKITNSKFYHESRTSDKDILQLKESLKELGLGGAKNQLHLSKMAEKLGVEVKEIDKNFVKVGDKQHLKMDLNTVFFSNRSEKSEKISADKSAEYKEDNNISKEKISDENVQLSNSSHYIEPETKSKKPKVKDHIRKIKKHKARTELKKDKQIKR
jgi:hypothetical protein